jgi:hypothetical protein
LRYGKKGYVSLMALSRNHMPRISQQEFHCEARQILHSLWALGGGEDMEIVSEAFHRDAWDFMT